MAFNWTPARLPQAEWTQPKPVDFSPLNRGIAQFVEGQKEARDLETRQLAGSRLAAGDNAGAENALFNAGMVDQGLNLRSTTAQQQRNAADASSKAAQRAAGLAQMAANETDPNRKSAIWKRVLSIHPDMAKGISEAGVDPNDIDTASRYVIAEARGYVDPTDQEAKKLGLEKTRAEINKLNTDVANAGSAYGKAGTIVQGNDGRFYSIQFGSGGQRKIEPLELGAGASGAGATPAGVGGNGEPVQPPAPIPLTPSRGVKVEGDLMYDAATGKTVRNVGSNIAEGERQKVIGRETAQGQVALPKAETALKQYEAKGRIVDDAIDTAIKNANGWTTGFGSTLSTIPGTAAHDLKNTLNTIKSNVGFDELTNMRANSPTGGALGNVSENENILLQSVLGALEQSQSQEQFVYNLNRLKMVRAEYKVLKRQAYEQDVARFGAANVPNPETGRLPGAGAPAGGTLPSPKSPSEYQALPSGTRYTAPDGSVRTKQ